MLAIVVATFTLDHIAMGIVLMIVMMGIKRNLWLGLASLFVSTKKSEVRRVVSDLFRMTLAADMLIEAHHGIGRGHHQMQVMRNKQHPTTATIAYLIYQTIKRHLTSDIHTAQVHPVPGAAGRAIVLAPVALAGFRRRTRLAWA